MDVLKRLILSSLFILCYVSVNAVIANPEPATVIQPDGSKLTVWLHGDEWFNYSTDSDGFTIAVNRASGFWEYAKLDSAGELVPNGEVAYDGKRSVTGVRHLKPVVSSSERQKQQKIRRNVLTTGNYDYSKFHGLVILVEYNDCPFSRDDYFEIMDKMVNQPQYDGYLSNHLLPSKINCTGSVRDYYYENSDGIFDPEFDVVGPVKIDYSQFYARKSQGAQTLVTAALRAADELVDYRDYDGDGNRTVDMVYFIFSGAGSNYSGNDERLIWPHASQIMNLNLDGVSFGRYACSTELYGAPANKLLDGIGTICHEFSHVLGLPDLYDTDYENGGQAIHPARWSIMASGSYLDKSKTPCGYSLFERCSLGFGSPKLIENTGTYSMQPLGSTDKPEGFMINSAIPNEYFLFEARVKKRWDAFLPGEGMLAYRVDYTNPTVWENNKVNVLASRTYYELLRATPKASGNSVTDSAGDPFPGSGNKTKLDNSTTPSLRSWTTTSTPLVLSDIKVDDSGVVEFAVVQDNTPTYIEDFATMPVTASDTLNVEGRFSTWDFTSGARIATDENGQNQANTVKGSMLRCNPFEGAVETCAITISNPTTQNAIFRFHYSTDNGATWTAVNTLENTANPSIARGTEMTIHYSLGNVADASFRLTQYSGNAATPCKVSKIEFGIKAGSVSGVREISSGMPDCGIEPRFYNLNGVEIQRPTAPGIYICRKGNKVEKFTVR